MTLPRNNEPNRLGRDDVDDSWVGEVLLGGVEVLLDT